MAKNKKLNRAKSLADLRKLLAQDKEGLEKFVYPRLRFGDVWWIPDEITGFAEKEKHPWVVVKGYSPGRITVVVCPRTTSRINLQRGIITPAGVLEGLDQPGLFVLEHRRVLPAEEFKDFSYIGYLSENWRQNIKTFIHSLAKRGKS